VKLCLDLNIWCAAYLADRAGRAGTAAQALVEAARTGRSPLCEVQLVVSWGMLERLKHVLVSQLLFELTETAALIDSIAGYAQDGPSLTLGGVGVIPVHDTEDRHVLETAWAGGADILVTANLADFVQTSDEAIVEGRVYQSRRGGVPMMLAHPFEAARWMRTGLWQDPDA
jgi:predicted nucleic acid-binding protein